MTRSLVLALALAALTLSCAESGPSQVHVVLPVERGAPRTPARLVLISVDGLTADRYRAAPGGAPEMRALAALARAGVAADTTQPVAPASRYPAHATLVTGRRPAAHGVVADRRLGDHGVRTATYRHASFLHAPTLWNVAAQKGLRVAALGWPSTLGAEIAVNVPDVEPTQRGETWIGLLGEAVPRETLALVQQAGGSDPAAQTPGAARDAVLIQVACQLIASQTPPPLMLIHLSQTSAPLARDGVDAPATRAAFAAVDAGLTRLLGCAQSAGLLADSAFAIVGDHGWMPVHTAVEPNAVLADAGLLTPESGGPGLLSWSALTRSNGGSAFVYAKRRDDALLARRALERAAEQTASFRVVSADEMLRLGADPDAWFGLEAAPGFIFSDATTGPVVQPATILASGGYLPDRPEMASAFVAWGAGLRNGIGVPELRQLDVAPTLGRLLGLSLDDSEGRVLVGLLALPPPGIAAQPLDAEATP